MSAPGVILRRKETLAEKPTPQQAAEPKGNGQEMRHEPMYFSKPFYREWQIAFNDEPSIRQIQRVIGESVLLQRGETRSGKNHGPREQLALYWHLEYGMTIAVDYSSGCIVAFLCKANKHYALEPGRSWLSRFLKGS